MPPTVFFGLGQPQPRKASLRSKQGPAWVGTAARGLKQVGEFDGFVAACHVRTSLRKDENLTKPSSVLEGKIRFMHFRCDLFGTPPRFLIGTLEFCLFVHASNDCKASTYARFFSGFKSARAKLPCSTTNRTVWLLMAVPESRTTQGQIVGGSNIFQASREKTRC